MRSWTYDYVGIPYKVHGRDDNGLDCWGLICLIYSQRYGIELPHYNKDYGSITTPEDIRELAKLFDREKRRSVDDWTPIELGDELDGDVILIPLVGNYTHVALCMGNKKMIHISSGINVTIEDYLGLKWRHRYNRSLIFRHNDLVGK